MSFKDYLNESFLMSFKVKRNWMIVKNYLYNVDLKWLNSLEEDEKFDVIDAYFYKNIFYALYEIKLNSKNTN